MKVNSFVVGFAEEVVGAMKHLDEQVAKLGNVKIHSVTDTIYGAELATNSAKICGPCIVRVVIYEVRKK